MNVLPRLADRWAGLPLARVRLWLGLLALLLAVRLLGLSWLMAVNVPFSDQWALLTRLYNGFQWSDVAVAFIWQHGPHRQGLNFSLVLPLYHLSGWNVRLDSLWTAGVQMLAGVLALGVRRRLIDRPWTLWDGILLLFFWGVGTYETVTVAPNASHSIFPLMLLMAWLLLWLAAPGWRRTVGLSLLTLSLCFTGFGLVALPGMALVLAHEVWRGSDAAQRGSAWVVLAALVLSVLAFQFRYRFVVAAGGFEVVRADPLDYLRFMMAMFGHLLLMSQNAPLALVYGVGASCLAVLGLVWLRAMPWLRSRGGEVRDARLGQVLLVLLMSSLAFAFLTAYGRAQLGVEAAGASRYTALMLPAVLAVYLFVCRLRNGANVWLMAMLVLATVRVVPETAEAVALSRHYAAIKLCWVDGYRQSAGHVAQANALMSQRLGAQGFEALWMGRQSYWDFMAQKSLGPFADDRPVSALLRWYPQPCDLLR